MGKPPKNVPSALKHGGFAGTTILPGEDEAAFNKLHRDLSVEFAPNGPLEEDIVTTIARLVWRKQNLKIYHSAEKAKERFSNLMSTLMERRKLPAEVASRLLNKTEHPYLPPRLLTEEMLAEMRALFGEIRQEMGTDWELVDIADVATIANLLSELSVVDRLDGMIDRCIKRLLMVRGIKSLAAPSKSSISRKRLSAA